MGSKKAAGSGTEKRLLHRHRRIRLLRLSGVWTLRRFRDNTLDRTWYGRAFIRAYYAVSPTLVRWFGKDSWFQALFRPMLDRLVDRLRQSGVEDTAYQDKY